MSATLFAEAGVGRGHHADEPFAIGAQGLHLDVGPQFEVAASDARYMKVGVHASETLDESVDDVPEYLSPLRCIADLCEEYDLEVERKENFQVG